MRRRRVAPGLLVVAVLAPAISSLAGCAPTAAELPDGVSVAVYQPRTEIESGRLVIQVTNDSDVPVTVRRAELESPDYSAPIVWERHDAPLSPGIAIDLRVDPVAPACGEPNQAPMLVTLDFRLEDGREGRAVVDATDPSDQFPGIPDALCLEVLLTEIADVRTVRLESDGRPGSPGRLVLAIAGADGEGTATLDVIRSTILVSLLGADGFPVTDAPIGLDVSSATEPTELSFPVRPGRCDPHAIAEDKEGTLFPLAVTLGDRRGAFRLPSTDEFRAQVYAFVRAYCG
jgi:hypothetical protein